MIRRFLLLFCLLAPQTLPAEEIDFEEQILPILEERCLYCHGEDEQESGLRLDLRARMLRGGDSGLAAVVPGKPEKSYLIEVINHVDEDMAMPPDDDKLPDEEIDLLTRWIKAGAVVPGQMDDVVNEE
ncbi:c-type cytochrome domain-containing protein, partial [Stieleria sp.]|uniref:c-type cytochrome domain-containing protein n=1 Tax=Stieleria sp. TaxID=2795976 RepID=UPI003562DC73